jgi:hypothetical protein
MVAVEPVGERINAVDGRDGEAAELKLDVFLFLLWRGNFARTLGFQIERWEFRVRDDVVGRALIVPLDEAATVERLERAGMQTLRTVALEPQEIETLPLDVVLSETMLRML